MLTKLKLALPLTLVLGMASTAIAAPKHPDHHQLTAGTRQVPAAAYQSFGSAAGTGQVHEPAYMYIQDQGVRNEVGG
jgi:hypothetical protein